MPFTGVLAVRRVRSRVLLSGRTGHRFRRVTAGFRVRGWGLRIDQQRR